MPHLGQTADDLKKEQEQNKDQHVEQQELNKPHVDAISPVVGSDVRTDKVSQAVIPPTEVKQVEQLANAALAQQHSPASNVPANSPLRTDRSDHVTEVGSDTFTVKPLVDGHLVTITPEHGLHHEFKAVCTCFWQGLFPTKEEAIERSKKHKQLRNVRPF